MGQYCDKTEDQLSLLKKKIESSPIPKFQAFFSLNSSFSLCVGL